jgi:hypothetical protein
MSALPGDTHRPSHMSDRHGLLTDPLHEQPAAVERQTSVTVTHEDLLDCGDGNPHSTAKEADAALGQAFVPKSHPDDQE